MYRRLLELLKITNLHKLHLPQDNYRESVIDLHKEVELMGNQVLKLKCIIDEWHKVLQESNKKYAEFESDRKYLQ
jgi:hypothetical protein